MRDRDDRSPEHDTKPIQRLDYQSGTFGAAQAQPKWLDNNVQSVLKELRPIVTKRLL